jgi:hypothetical protein
LVKARGVTGIVVFELVEDIEDGGVWWKLQQFAPNPAPVFTPFLCFIITLGGHFESGIAGWQEK